MSFQLYGANWPDSYKGNPLAVEMRCIQLGGKWKGKNGSECGEGLSFHYERMRNILWPKLDDHRWHRLTRDTILTTKVTVLMGAGSTGKTHAPSWIFLCEYFCFPDETCVLVSSTTTAQLRMRVWGEMTEMWKQAVARFPFLPGHIVDSRMLLATDDLSENEVDGERVGRDWRKGIKAIACKANGRYSNGLESWVGIKSPRIRVVADEAQFMPSVFLDAFANLNSTPDFKAVILGNPNDPTDALGKAAEPKDGWLGHMEPKETEVWDTRFLNGKCVNLVGTDSPNNDYSDELPDRYKYLISKRKIAEVLTITPRDSILYYSQCMGVMKISVLSRRIVTREMCEKYHALEDVTWRSTGNLRISALDAAYGGDRCVAGYADLGKNANGETILKIYDPWEIPISVRSDNMSPEDQISNALHSASVDYSFKAENFFYDSTGRGALGISLARNWSDACNPVEFGGPPTDRPVSMDHYIIDPETKMRRLKRCDEHYDRFVSELHFSVAYVIEGAQMRALPSKVMEELCERKWDRTKGEKIAVERKTGTPTKPGFKERMGYSPDFGDWLALIVEGARQRGFEIKKLATPNKESESSDWFKEEAKRYRTAINSNLLKHS